MMDLSRADNEALREIVDEKVKERVGGVGRAPIDASQIESLQKRALQHGGYPATCLDEDHICVLFQYATEEVQRGPEKARHQQSRDILKAFDDAVAEVAAEVSDDFVRNRRPARRRPEEKEKLRSGPGHWPETPGYEDMGPAEAANQLDSLIGELGKMATLHFRADYVQAAQSLAFSCVFRESIGLSSLVSALIDEWCAGGLVLCDEDASNRLYRYRRQRFRLLPEDEIQTSYRRVLGVGARTRGGAFNDTLAARMTALDVAISAFVRDHGECECDSDDHLIAASLAAFAVAESLDDAMTECDVALAAELVRQTWREVRLFQSTAVASALGVACVDGEDVTFAAMQRLADRRLDRSVSITDAFRVAELTRDVIREAFVVVPASPGTATRLVQLGWELHHRGGSRLGLRPATATAATPPQQRETLSLVQGAGGVTEARPA